MRRLAAVLLWALGCAAAAQDAATPVAARDAAATLAAARTAVERRDYTAALPLYERLAAAADASADLLVEAARVNGYADRNAEAAALYRRALAAAPARRGDIVPSLAWQSLWAGDAAAALALFGEMLGADSPPARRAEFLDGLAQARQARGDLPGALGAFHEASALAPADARLQRRVALALLWNDRHDEAIAMLAALRAKSAVRDRDLDWTLANALNFAGRHREALRLFTAHAAPVASGERVDLARAWRWAGFEERALPLLGEPLDAEARWLKRWRVERELRPYGYATFESSTDRDALDAQALVVGAGTRPRPGANVEVNVRRVRLDDAFGASDGSRAEATVQWRYGDIADAAGTFWPRASLRLHRWPGWSPVTATLRTTWVPRDGVRVDAEASRELVETPRALANRVSVDVVSLGADWRPDVRHLVAGAVAALRFDDGTRRTRFSARAERALVLKPRWTVGIEAQRFERTPALPNVDRGYWNPRRYDEWRATTTLTHEWRPFDLFVRLGAGSSRETDGSGRVTRGRPDVWEAGLGADLAPHWRARLVAGGSGQGMGVGGGGAGYWRRYVNLSVNAWF